MPRNRHQSRDLQRRADEITEEVQLAGIAVDGIMALSDHIMGRAVKLDGNRRSLARSCGPEMNQVLVEYEVTALDDCKRVQRGLVRTWGY